MGPYDLWLLLGACKMQQGRSAALLGAALAAGVTTALHAASAAQEFQAEAAGQAHLIAELQATLLLRDAKIARLQQHLGTASCHADNPPPRQSQAAAAVEQAMADSCGLQKQAEEERHQEAERIQQQLTQLRNEAVAASEQLAQRDLELTRQLAEARREANTLRGQLCLSEALAADCAADQALAKVLKTGLRDGLRQLTGGREPGDVQLLRRIKPAPSEADPLPGSWEVWLAQLATDNGQGVPVDVAVKRCLADAKEGGQWPEAARQCWPTEFAAASEAGGRGAPSRPMLGSVLREASAALAVGGMGLLRDACGAPAGSRFANPLLDVCVSPVSASQRALHGFAHEVVMVFPLLERGDLRSSHDEAPRQRLVAPPSLDEVLAAGCQYAAGLEALHAAGLVWCDGKLENCGLATQGQGHVVLFDLAGLRSLDTQGRYQGLIEYTQGYAAPEQLPCKRQGQDQGGQAPYACRASDLHALGHGLFLMLEAWRECGGQDARAGEMMQLALHCVEEEPAQRPTASVVCDSLQALYRRGPAL